MVPFHYAAGNTAEKKIELGKHEFSFVLSLLYNNYCLKFLYFSLLLGKINFEDTTLFAWLHGILKFYIH